MFENWTVMKKGRGVGKEGGLGSNVLKCGSVRSPQERNSDLKGGKTLHGSELLIR